MKAARSYFQSIARTTPRGAVVLRPQSGILQRWQSAAAPPWMAPPPASSRRDTAAGVVPESPDAEPPLFTKHPNTPQHSGDEPGISPSQSRPLSMSRRTTEEPAFDASPRPMASSVAAHGNGEPQVGSAQRDASAASRDLSPSPAVQAARAAEAAPGIPPVDRAFANPAPHASPRRSVGMGEPAAPAKPGIHIGAIEVHVTPPAAPHVPAAMAAPRAITRKPSLSRGYLSRYGWDQA